MKIQLSIIVILVLGNSLAFAQTNESFPQPVTNWLATHHNFTGCVHWNLKTGEATIVSCIHPELRPFAGMIMSKNSLRVMSPLEQFKDGIPPRNTICDMGLALIIKSDDNSPRCVKPDTAMRLIQRGWASEFVQSEQVNTSTECQGIEVSSGNFRTFVIPVLLMKSNSTATVCVTYNLISDWNSYPNKEVFPHGIIETGLLVNNAKYSTTPSGGLTVVADPPLFNATNLSNNTKFVVLYQFHAGVNSTGFLDNSILYDSCLHYPMAIGYASSQVNESDFSQWIKLPPPCFYSIYDVDSVTLVSGINYTLVNFR